MGEPTCCKELVEVSAQVKVLQGKISTGRWFVAGILLFGGIILSQLIPQSVDFTVRIEGKLDGIQNSVQAASLEVREVAIKQTSIRRDLTTHMNRTGDHERNK